MKRTPRLTTTALRSGAVAIHSSRRRAHWDWKVCHNWYWCSKCTPQIAMNIGDPAQSLSARHTEVRRAEGSGV